jgi:hypothetical protein
MIPNAAHHLDLMFPDETDSKELLAARQLTLQLVTEWTKQ